MQEENVSVITREARQWAERAYPQFVFEVGRHDIQRYAHAIGESNPVHFDPVAAREAGHPDIVAPPFFPYVIRMHASNLVARGRLGADGS